MTKFLRGKVSKGMFPDELVLLLADHDGGPQALIVQSELVKQSGEDGLVEVQIVDQREGLALIRLPGELVTAGHVISVKESQLEAV